MKISGPILFAVLLPLCAMGNASGAIIANGSFEDVQLADPFFSRNLADVPGWTHFGAAGTAYMWAIGYADNSGDPSHNNVSVAGDGRQFVTMGGGYQDPIPEFAGWSQTLTGLAPGNSYQLTFQMAAEGDTGFGALNQTITVDFPSGSSTAAQSFTSSPAGNYWRDWVGESMNFVATDSSLLLRFSATTVNDVGLDAVSLSDITSTLAPEPSTIVLLGSALFAIAGNRFLRWRRRR